ncbi:MAG: hypothetical protein VYD64_09085 [Pseudomonadota bacterium]|nr:hypothetical protein [Pseudomonadota bacterium]
MNGSMPLSLLSGIAAGQASSWLTRARRKAVFLALVGVLALSAWALLVSAAVAALAQAYGAPVAALAGAGFLIAMAAIVIAVMRYIDWRERRKLREEQSRRATLMAAAAAATLPSMIRNRPLLTLALVGGAGLLASHFLANGEE